MDSSTLDDFLWLVSDSARSILKETQEAFVEQINVVRVAKNLRAKTTVNRAAIVMDQARLRIRARKKFVDADRMFFTRRGLEQSTSQEIAEYKATRFDGLATVADLCSGIGGDLIGLVNRLGAKTTVGVDSDELTCLFAQHNAELAALRVARRIALERKKKHFEKNQNSGTKPLPEPQIKPSEVTIEHKQFADIDLSQFEAVHVDPDRRLNQRTVTGGRFSPTLDEVIAHIKPGSNLAIKVAPATPPPKTMTSTVEREWIGDRRECKQQVIWYGWISNNPGHRTATCVSRNGKVDRVSVPEEEAYPTPKYGNKIDRYVFEAHPAVLAAELNDVIAQRCDLVRLGERIAYLTGDHEVHNPLVKQYEVAEVTSLHLRSVAKFLKQKEIGRIVVKKRAIDNVTYEKFKRLKLEGPNKATVFLTRLGRKRVAIITRRRSTDFDI